MRCREVEALWDEVRSAGMPSLRQAVKLHLRNCPPCQDLYEEYEGVAYCLSCLEVPEPSCDLAKKIVMHIAEVRHRMRSEPLYLSSLHSPIGRLFVGYNDVRIAYVEIDRRESLDALRRRIQERLKREVIVKADLPAWVRRTFNQFFKTWHVDDERVDVSDLTPFEQAALRKAAQIPPGEVRSYMWVAREIGRPNAARAVGQVMARNPLPLLFPCHRVVDSAGKLHNYGYGLEMKARILKMEGYRAVIGNNGRL
ncbi:MAG: methylated-DNA--[protein]-cysteine S-methyltransferase [Candidatus Eremiobacteraeota bacterium]|nr:methylated-DNA--[protein]-cysteine S-methyltransferase [Candidatus Eremiobacteraeota bacterium]